MAMFFRNNVKYVCGSRFVQSRALSSSVKSLDVALAYSAECLKLIHSKGLLDTDTARSVIQQTTSGFAEHFNPGFLEYRKSATIAGDWASVEWKGSGSKFQDVLGREYIDCLGGFGLFSHGWSNPDVVAAVRSQLERCPMPSQELLDPLRAVLARLLANITPGKIKYSFFVASGTEAVEGAIKVAKLYTKKDGFIAATNAFHGKTMGSLSMMGKSSFRKPLGALYGGPVFHVPFGDADAMEKQLETCNSIGIDIAAVILEPIQGEGGCIVPPEDYWPRVRAATKKYGVLLIADEVQTGLGRTGKLWGVDHWNVEPDIMCLGKSLGGGVMPVAAFCSTEQIWMNSIAHPNPFIQTTTTGGGALACSAAIAAIHVVLRDKLCEAARVRGEYMIPKLQELAVRYPDIYAKITGRGLLIGQHFHDDETGYKVAAAMFKRGVVLSGTLTNARTIRIEPPLMIPFALLDRALNCLEDSLREVRSNMGKSV
jgi:putrescine aminotransferase